MKLTLRHLEWLQVKTENEKISLGYNQEWFGTDWQRLAGCGPTTATQIINYISCRDGYVEALQLRNKHCVMQTMEQVFPYVKPRRAGLYKTRWMKEGLEKYVQDRNWNYEVKMLRIYPFAIMRPSEKDVAKFILDGILSDCPIAFLNRHKGHEEGLDTWHWVPIIAIEERDGKYFAFVYDDEQMKEFSINDWLKDSVLGGGFVYLENKAKGE